MGLCWRNLLVSCSINLGPRCFLVIWVYCLFGLGFFVSLVGFGLGIFFPFLLFQFCCVVVILFKSNFVILCLKYVPRVWVFCCANRQRNHYLSDAAVLLPSWCRLFCWWVICVVVWPQWTPFGHDINSIFLKFTARNSVPWKQYPGNSVLQLWVQAVLLTFCTAVFSSVCVHTLTLLKSYCSCASFNISLKMIDNNNICYEKQWVTLKGT